jgi:hypothetical protein
MPEKMRFTGGLARKLWEADVIALCGPVVKARREKAGGSLV